MASAPVKWGSLVVAIAGVAIPVMLNQRAVAGVGARRRRRAVGLRNSGNLCFFNSLMQSLAGVRAFSSFLEDVSRELDRSPAATSFAGELHRLLDTLAAGAGAEGDAPAPERIINQLKRKLDFQDQQDAQELWSLIMEIVDREAAGIPEDETVSLSLASAGGPTLGGLGGPAPAPGADDAVSVASSRGSWLDEGLSNPFMGFVGDSLCCSKCKSARPMRLSRFFHISLEIPGTGAAETKEAETPPTLEECLSQWLVHERLDNVECLSCSAGEQLDSLRAEERLVRDILAKNGASPGVEENLRHILAAKDALQQALAKNDAATVEELVGEGSGFRVCRRMKFKQLLLVRSPQALCLHINRRKFHAATNAFYKDNRRVTVSPQLALGNVACDPAVALPRPTATYRLMSVIVHHGGAGSGHFTTFRKDLGDRDRWHHFSDEQVAPATFAEVARSAPYMLFYEKEAAEAR